METSLLEFQQLQALTFILKFGLHSQISLLLQCVNAELNKVLKHIVTTKYSKYDNYMGFKYLLIF